MSCSSRPETPQAVDAAAGVPPKPDWIRVKAPQSEGYRSTLELIRKQKLHTVCEEAACPNIGECWTKKHATVMILGDTCTRACRFCNVKTGKPLPVDPDEPARLGEAIKDLGLQHVVITSVDRDDLPDGGARHFAQCINEVRAAAPGTTVEVLTPDFLRKPGALEIVAEASPDVFNHNIETVPSLYTRVRPGARYFHSLYILKRAKELNPGMFTKSGVMVGLGETRQEILQVMDDMRAADVDFMTIGQYLRPTPAHVPVARYVTPDEFQFFAGMGKAKGFLLISSSPMTRSSYHADADFKRLQDARRASRARPAA